MSAKNLKALALRKLPNNKIEASIHSLCFEGESFFVDKRKFICFKEKGFMLIAIIVA